MKRVGVIVLTVLFGGMLYYVPLHTTQCRPLGEEAVFYHLSTGHLIIEAHTKTRSLVLSAQFFVAHLSPLIP